MTRRTKISLLAGAAVAAIAAGGAAVAGAAGGDSDAPIHGAAQHRASAAALEHVGGGRVTGTEVGDEESRYEVEVTREDGGQVDVQLDAAFRVVGAAQDQGR